jgi:hypothetical protein
MRLPNHKLTDTIALLLLASALIAPLFHLGYLDNWPSIESTFIADARLLAANLPHPGWQPFWYCGTRFDYIYPPALRYGTALISLVGSIPTARAYHIYTALLYILGPVSCYWLVLIGSKSRVTAWISAVAVALCSPSLILVRTLGNDSSWMVPQRLHVLISYGEGPHISALSILPAALAATFVALRRSQPLALALAGVFCAFTVANNFYGATALACFFPAAVWAVWLGTRDIFVWFRAAGIVALAYGLSAFWLTPAFLRLTMLNLKWVSAPGDPRSRLIMLIAIVIFCDITYRWANRRPDRTWFVFVTGAAVILSVQVLGNFYFDLHVVGEASRLAPELDMALLLLVAAVVTHLWRTRKFRFEAAMLLLLIFFPTVRYLRHAWSPFVATADVSTVYEYRITKWVHDNLPGLRVMPSGTIRFWYDAWFDNAQPDGGSDQGLLNQGLQAARYQLTAHDNGVASILWLQALGASAIIVPDKNSPEHYHDFAAPQKFLGLLPVIFDDRQGTVIYSVPRIFPSLGRVVDRAGELAVQPIRAGDDIERLRQYVSVIEAPKQAETTVQWSGLDALQMKAQVGDGQSVLFQETYDPAWRAFENGKPLPIRPDPFMDFMVIDVPAGAHTIDLRFQTPRGNRIGQFLFVVSLMIIIWLVWSAATARQRA